MNDSKRIVFAGTPDFSVPPLRAWVPGTRSSGSMPSRTARRPRPQSLSPSPVKEVAVDAGIRHFSRPISSDPADVAVLESLHADLMIVVAYGLLLPGRARCAAPGLRQHPCLGAAALAWCGADPARGAGRGCDLRGDHHAHGGGSGYRADVPDRGTSLADDETGGSLHDRLSTLGAGGLMKACRASSTALWPPSRRMTAIPATPKLDKGRGDDRLDASGSPISKRQVRAFNPWPVAQTRFEDAFLRVWRAHAIGGVGAPGTVMNATRSGIDVATGDGLLRITELQLPGKRAMSAQDFINANNIQGTLLG